MRTLARNSVERQRTFTYSDAQVLFIARFMLFAGSIMGGTIVGVVLSIMSH